LWYKITLFGQMSFTFTAQTRQPEILFQKLKSIET
jgi:hypothetical protein